jgi:hypothetical protein
VSVVAVGQVWQRKPPKKQRLRVERVWVAGRGLLPDEPEIAGKTVVSLVPLNGGGRYGLLSTVRELIANATLVEAAP